ncbi:type II toxin-antitoxin system ParD family antitoxin [Marinobacter sp. DY40_1A1]|uniref:type II toxin-antitoxin system ParD family antitoxin n=1 Tax=Marinobacter sp. DY40_1A1 TaxID=2583229 RepID=UPI001904895E|nr:type II toxin-antitoxin system ParD family antitoxin [Marinobacter sp. DY40_1A1]MBK1885459.1 type II toxin-antitoxin system ParD family antitoxin [Marinobacter sp. DY40_1A1]
MATRNIVLTDHQEQLVGTLVKAGRYQNASEVLREGLRLVEEQELQHQQKLLVLRDAVAEGLQDVAEGRTTTLGVGEEIAEYLSRRATKLTKKD